MKYWAYFWTSFRSTSTYKVDFIIYIFANMIFFFIFFAVWKSIYLGSGVTEISNYTLTQTITYYLITSSIFRFDPTAFMYLNEDIWIGTYTNDLIKPWNAVWVDIVYTLNQLFFNVLLYIPFVAVIVVIASEYLILATPLNMIFTLITVIIGVFLAISFYLIIHALCLHIGDQDANISLSSYIISFLAGGFLPLSFLPGKIQSVVQVLPFRFLFDVPANIYLGKLTTLQVYSSWGQMLLWMALFFIIFYFIYKTGIKKYTGTGR